MKNLIIVIGMIFSGHFVTHIWLFICNIPVRPEIFILVDLGIIIGIIGIGIGNLINKRGPGC